MHSAEIRLMGKHRYRDRAAVGGMSVQTTKGESGRGTADVALSAGRRIGRCLHRGMRVSVQWAPVWDVAAMRGVSERWRLRHCTNIGRVSAPCRSANVFGHDRYRIDSVATATSASSGGRCRPSPEPSGRRNGAGDGSTEGIHPPRVPKCMTTPLHLHPS